MFCKHGRRTDQCMLCAGEKRRADRAAAGARKRPVTGSGPRNRASVSSARPGAAAARERGPSRGAMRVRRLARPAADGWANELLPGVRSSVDALDLCAQLAHAAARLETLAGDEAPGAYGRARHLVRGAAADADRDAAARILFLAAYLGPLEADDPFASIDAVDAAAAGAGAGDDVLAEALAVASVGPRGAHEAARGAETVLAFRAWAARREGAAAGLRGEATLDAARRFDRVYQGLALPGLPRAARYELLVTAGRVGLAELEPWSLLLEKGSEPTTLAAKRAFQIGDPVLLQRRASALARELDLPVAALDLGLRNWDAPAAQRVRAGVVVAEADVAEHAALLGEALGIAAEPAGEDGRGEDAPAA